MKIGGITVTKPARECLIIPRQPDNIVLWGQALDDLDEFDAMCPAPTPGWITTKEGPVLDTAEKGFVSRVTAHNNQRNAYLAIKSLGPSEIEWTNVKLGDPNTWSGWQKDLRDAGFTQVEVNRVWAWVLDINSLNEAKLEAARASFLRGRAAV